MIRKIAVTLLLCLPMLAQAQLETQFRFTGQNAEALKLNRAVTVQRPVPKQVPGTCQRPRERQVPGTCIRQIPRRERVCRDVTRHRQECRWIPASQNCWTESDRVCRTETYNEKECHEGPSRQVCVDEPDRKVCTNRPDRQECTTGPSRQVCQDRPSREVCSERTGQRVCSTIPGARECKEVPGERQCRTVDGGQDCRVEPGRQRCHTERGEPVCRQVPRSRQVCHDVPRERCESIPGRNHCEQIPYSEEVCGMETVHYPEEYACMKTEVYQEDYACMKTEMVMEPVQKLLTADIAVAINTNGLVDEFLVDVAATAKNADMKAFDLALKLSADPKVLVVLKKKEIRVLEETAQEIKVQGSAELEIRELKGMDVVFPSQVKSATLLKAQEQMQLGLKGELPAGGLIDIKIVNRDGAVVVDAKAVRILGSKLSSGLFSGKSNVYTLDLRGKILGQLNKAALSVRLSVPLKVTGEILNPKKPESEKLFENLKLKVK